MKYIHDGKTYVIFTVYEGESHSSMVSMLYPFETKHAGFLSFHNDERTKEALTYGHSSSLTLTSQKFEYDEVNYVGVTENEFIIISNNKEVLERLSCRDIEEAVWKHSEEGNYGECPVIYPSHSFRNLKACALLRS